MVHKGERIELVNQKTGEQNQSAIDLWRHMGGKSRPVGERAADSMLAVFKDRATYTFILDDEVASIHFDRTRGEIFFKGHNIRHLTLTGNQINALNHMKEVLITDSKAKRFLNDYSATLARYLADNK